MAHRIWSSDVVALGDQIAGLTPVQAAVLRQYLADIHGVETVAMTETLRDPQPDVFVQDGKAEPTSFDIVLDGLDRARKIPVIKAVREQLGLGLKEAKDLVEAAPSIIKEGLPQGEAESLLARLEAAGAKVSLQPSLS